MKSRKRKAQGDVRSLKSSKTRKEDETDNKLPEGVAAEEGRPTKKQVNDCRRGNGNKFSSEGKEERSKQKLKTLQRGGNPEGQKPHLGENKAVNARKLEEEVGSRKKKTAFQERIEQQKERKKAKRNKDPLGRDVVDKLDMLIEQYRSKFSQHISNKTDGEKQGSRQIRRWFES